MTDCPPPRPEHAADTHATCGTCTRYNRPVLRDACTMRRCSAASGGCFCFQSDFPGRGASYMGTHEAPIPATLWRGGSWGHMCRVTARKARKRKHLEQHRCWCACAARNFRTKRNEPSEIIQCYCNFAACNEACPSIHKCILAQRHDGFMHLPCCLTVRGRCLLPPTMCQASLQKLCTKPSCGSTPTLLGDDSGWPEGIRDPARNESKLALILVGRGIGMGCEPVPAVA
jgi:hypothetical protein